MHTKFPGAPRPTSHQIIIGNANHIPALPDGSVALVVTSPPYPMIEMWDECFCAQDAAIRPLLATARGPEAFEAMHRLLDRVWDEVYRVLTPGGFACINIGDATRTLDGVFRLYANHARILSHCLSLGFDNLPAIIWRKQTNAPNKFMGSGMLPAGAYVTLEHEYILILRKGQKQAFATPEAKALRQESAFFWEERNAWFSDVWFDIKGSRQSLALKGARERSAAFPFEIAYRLVCMYSLKGGLVLDPFAGTGTTLLAAAAAERDSAGVEIDQALADAALAGFDGGFVDGANAAIAARLEAHLDYVEKRGADFFTHRNAPFGFPVKTRQETGILLRFLKQCRRERGRAVCDYHEGALLSPPVSIFQG